MHRSATSQSRRPLIRTPTPTSQIQNRKQLLLSRKHTRNGHKSQFAFKQVSTPFRQTGVTFNPTSLIQRIRTNTKNKKNGFLSQNLYKQKDRLENNAVDADSIPVRLLRLTKLSQQKSDNYPIYSQRFQSCRKQFLRKGASINRAIMFNVLKSKCNQNIVDCSASYVNYPKNAILSAAIYDQVPKGLRDVIGPQQMLRMSNIFTGGTISAINLHKKVNQIVKRYHETKKQPQIEQQQGTTLKSIKRW